MIFTKRSSPCITFIRRQTRKGEKNKLIEISITILEYFDPRLSMGFQSNPQLKNFLFEFNSTRVKNGFLSQEKESKVIDDREKRSIILFSNECWRNSEVFRFVQRRETVKFAARILLEIWFIWFLDRSIDPLIPCFPLRRTPIVGLNLAIIDRRLIGLRHTPLAPRSCY